jgi:translocation and assembly module TamB
MEASGPASEPRLLFTSDPPLTSHQVFLMLTTGAVPDEDHTIGASDRASRLAMFLGRNLAAGLGLGGTGTGGDARLSIRSGEDFSREGRETVTVQYDLDGRWSVVGEYDRFDAYNGGIKFRLINR